MSAPGVNGTVYAMAVFDDGSGPALYVGGTFSQVGGIFADNIARWDGTDWSPLAAGTNGPVYALATHDEGSGMRLFAGGNFSTAGGVSMSCIGRWNGNAWSALGNGLNNSVNALEVFGGKLHAGGAFTLSNLTPLPGVGRWSGSTWEQMGLGVNNPVYALKTYDVGTPELWVGGAFTTAGGASSNRIARWSGTAWVSVGPGLDNWAETLTVYDGSLYVGGIFSTAGGVSANGIARKNVVTWSAVGGGLGSAVTASGVYNDDASPNPKLFAGGDFTTGIGAPGNRIAAWDGSNWSPLAQGVDNGTVYALLEFQNKLYVGGSFTSVSSIPASGIARWTGPHRLYVNGGANGANDGTSWANAYTTLQGALGAAGMINSGIDEIWVARGIYKPDLGPGITLGNRNATFQLINGVAIHGGFAGDETAIDQRNPTLNTTILSGDLNGNDAPVVCTQNSPDCDSFGSLCVGGSCIISSNNAENSYRVVTGSGTNATAVLDGFTITAGNANVVSFQTGAGMYNDSGSPTVTNCTFRGNSSTSAGSGMFNGSASAPFLTHCTFRGNSALSGSGMHNNGSNPKVIDCTFSGNSATLGAGMQNFNGSNPSVINCTFCGNSSSDSGGGMYNSSGAPTLINCLFSGNVANNGGGVSNVGNVFLPMTNCTFSGNSASTSGGGIYNGGGGNPPIRNCILWRNIDAGGMDESAQVHVSSGSPVVNFSIVQGGWTGSGANNLNADPLFFDPDGADNIVGTLDDDLRLRAGSPAIDSGDTTAVPLDTLDVNGNGNTTERISIDLAGSGRMYEDADTPNTGVIDPGYPPVDRGAYEYFTDCNHNGILDVGDIGSFTSLDCNGNWIPDECEMAACGVSEPFCNDCNLNGTLDVCDINSMFSQDVDENGIPDECSVFTDSCLNPGSEQFWTCPDNWDLGGQYPDNIDSAAGVFVTLPTGVVAFLNETVVIPSLRIAEEAELQITQSGAQGDLQFSAPAIMEIHGYLLVSGSRDIGSAGTAPQITIGPGGVYEAAPGAVAGVVSASLIGASISLVGNDCFIPPCPHGGEVALTDSMSITTTGDLLIDGSLANGHCDLHGARSAHQKTASDGGGEVVLSFHTPPSMHLPSPGTRVIVGANVVLVGAAGFLNESLLPFDVGGDWENQSVRPDCFEAVVGTIRMNGGGAPQTFEVAATDTGGNGGSSDNFRIGTLEVAANSDVTLVDAFNNDLQGQASCGEAQYVDNLVLEAGATLTAQNCRLYYDTLTADPSSQIILQGCAEVRPAADPSPAASDPTGLNKSRSISFIPPAGVLRSPGNASNGFDPGTAAIRVTLMSLHHVNPPYSGGSSIPFTSFEGQVRWVGPPAQYVESISTGTPFKAASLQCTPYYQDWSTVGLVHVFGSGITPSSTYRVQVLASSCQGIEDHCTAVSSPLSIATTRWGDVESPYNPPSTTTQPDLGDVASLVNKFKSVLGAPIKARALLVGDDAFGNISPGTLGLDLGFGHIAACVDAFKGKPYPHTIQACP